MFIYHRDLIRNRQMVLVFPIAQRWQLIYDHGDPVDQFCILAVCTHSYWKVYPSFFVEDQEWASGATVAQIRQEQDSPTPTPYLHCTAAAAAESHHKSRVISLRPYWMLVYLRKLSKCALLINYSANRKALATKLILQQITRRQD